MNNTQKLRFAKALVHEVLRKADSLTEAQEQHDDLAAVTNVLGRVIDRAVERSKEKRRQQQDKAYQHLHGRH